MRIAIGVPENLAEPDGSGFISAFRDVERALGRHETVVFSPSGGDVPLGPKAGGAGLAAKYRNTMALAKDFARKAGKASPDAVLAFTGMGMFLKQKHVYYTSNVPYKAVARLVRDEYPRTERFRRLMRHYRFVAGKEAEFYRRAERIVVLSKKVKELISAEHGIDEEKISYIPRPVPRLSAPAQRKEDGVRMILMPAELRVMKGIRYAIETMKILKKTEPRAVLVMRGRVNGYERRYVEGLLAESRGKANIAVLGFMPRERFYSFMRAADCAFMPFCFDECPISLRECLGNCLPVVTNEYAGYERRVIQSFGSCVERNDVEGYAEALSRMLSDPRHKRKKTEGAARMAVEYPFEKYQEALNDVFERS